MAKLVDDDSSECFAAFGTAFASRHRWRQRQTCLRLLLRHLFADQLLLANMLVNISKQLTVKLLAAIKQRFTHFSYNCLCPDKGLVTLFGIAQGNLSDPSLCLSVNCGGDGPLCGLATIKRQYWGHIYLTVNWYIQQAYWWSMLVPQHYDKNVKIKIQIGLRQVT